MKSGESSCFSSIAIVLLGFRSPNLADLQSFSEPMRSSIPETVSKKCFFWREHMQRSPCSWGNIWYGHLRETDFFGGWNHCFPWVFLGNGWFFALWTSGFRGKYVPWWSDRSWTWKMRREMPTRRRSRWVVGGYFAGKMGVIFCPGFLSQQLMGQQKILRNWAGFGF